MGIQRGRSQGELRRAKVKTHRTMDRTMDRTIESTSQFELRKGDHLEVAMDPRSQAVELRGAELDRFQFIHEALPDFDFSDVSLTVDTVQALQTSALSASPFFVSSMTAGHAAGSVLNARLAAACAKRGWLMGVGSQRRELFDANGGNEWRAIRSATPNVSLIGNIGLSQLIDVGAQRVQGLVNSLDAVAMIVHLNPLQECLQLEGTPQFKDGLRAIEALVESARVPIIVKETGCGISGVTARRLIAAGVRVIDVAGRGGTHWGRIEGLRAAKSPAGSVAGSVIARAAQTFQNWGLSTVDSLTQVVHAGRESDVEVWASGGIRSGLDAAKALCLGAARVGVAQPFLAAALKGDEELSSEMDRFEFELKVAMFCIGARNIHELRRAQLTAVDSAAELRSEN